MSGWPFWISIAGASCRRMLDRMLELEPDEREAWLAELSTSIAGARVRALVTHEQ